MEGFGKNFKFWGWYYAKTDSLTTAMILGIVLITSVFDGGNFLEVFFTMLPLYLCMMILMETIVFGFTSITVVFPFAVGMGAKRDSCIAAKAALEHIVFIINAIFATIAYLYTHPEMTSSLPVAIPLIIIVMGLLMTGGNLVALLSNKFGRTAGMIVYIVIIFAAIVGTTIFIASEAAETLLTVLIYNTFSLCVVIAVIALILDALSVYLLFYTVKTKDLNFSV